MEPLANLIDQLLKLDAELKSPAGLELTAVEIADALWLAGYLPPPPVAAPANENSGTPESTDPIDPVDLELDSGKDSPPPDSSEIDSSAEKVKQEDDLVRESQQQQQSPNLPESPEVKSAKRERVYPGYALSNRRQIEQALRPLKRRAPSAIESELDEDETIERSAQFSLLNIRIIDPVLRAVQKRWLEVDLIVDNSNSMVVWQETAAEFGQLLRHQGFRDVRMWHLETEKAPTISPFRKKRGSTSLASCIKLPPAQGDRIVLVITDCVAPAWQNFSAFNLLAEWAKQSSVTLFQVWPEYFWFRTILSNIDTRASAYNPAVPNIRLITQREPDPFFDFLKGEDRQQMPRSVFIPVVPLEDPHALSKWAQMVAGIGRFWLPAIEVPSDIAAQTQPNDNQKSRPTETDPRELVDRFQATASPITQELGGLLASVPLELPIMRLVQETMSNSHLLHLSEFLTSGLVYRKQYKKNENFQTSEPVFEFFEGVRILLRRTVRISETIEVLKKVGKVISERSGQGRRIDAFISDSHGSSSLTLNEHTLPFAKLQLEVLESLGPLHRSTANQLRKAINEFSDGIPESGTDSINHPQELSNKANIDANVTKDYEKIDAQSKFWTLAQISLTRPRTGYEFRSILPAQEFLQQQIPNLNHVTSENITILLLSLFHAKTPDVDNISRALAGLCLRCYVSYPILKACQKLDNLFGGNRQFTYQDLLPFVLNDDGKTLLILDSEGKTQLQLDRSGNPQPTPYKTFAVEVLRTFKSDSSSSMSLGNWAFLQTKQNPELKSFLSEFDVQSLSDWALLNQVRPNRLEQLSERDRALVEVFHAVYRRDRRQQREVTKYLAPSSAQLQEMLTRLEKQGVLLSSPQALYRALQQVASQLKLYDVWSSREALELPSQDDGTYVARSDLPYNLVGELDVEEQELLEFFQTQLKVSLTQAVEQEINNSIARLASSKKYAPFAQQFIPGLKLYYEQGLSLKEIAPILGMSSYQARRILNPGELLSKVRAATVQQLSSQILAEAQEKGFTQSPPSPDYLNTLSEQIELFVDQEIFQAAGEELRQGKYRSMNSVYAQELRRHFQSHEEVRQWQVGPKQSEQDPSSID